MDWPFCPVHLPQVTGKNKWNIRIYIHLRFFFRGKNDIPSSAIVDVNSQLTSVNRKSIYQKISLFILILNINLSVLASVRHFFLNHGKTMNLCNLLVFSEKLLAKEYFKMFGGKFQKCLAGSKKWQRRGASFFFDRIPYGKLPYLKRKNASFPYGILVEKTNPLVRDATAKILRLQIQNFTH